MQNKSQSDVFFEKYRTKLKEADEMKNELKAVESKVSSMKKDMANLYHEISVMRSIITDMIDNNWDPVEANLKRNPNDINISLWDITLDNINPTTYVVDSSSSTQCTTSSNYKYWKTTIK